MLIKELLQIAQQGYSSSRQIVSIQALVVHAVILSLNMHAPYTYVITKAPISLLHIEV